MTAPGIASSPASDPRELYVRHARKNGRLLLTMTALDYDDGNCVVDVQLGGHESGDEREERSYRFAGAREATTFVTEAVEALIYLGCEIRE